VSEIIDENVEQPAKNKGGRPRGSRSRPKANALMDRLAKAHAPEIKEIFEMTVKMAKEGKPWAVEAILARVWPAPKERTVRFELPPILTAADAEAAIGAVLQAVAAGFVSPTEGDKIVSIIQTKAEATHMREIEDRMTALEQAQPRTIESYRRLG
jgi:hypothetical protein